MTRGRPTDYNEELLYKAKMYLDNHEVAGDVVPQLAGFAVYLGIHRDTLYEWEKDDAKKEFSDIVKQIRIKQEQVLLNGSLLGEFNPSISKLMLTKHGYSDKAEIDHTTKGDKVQSIAPHNFVGGDDEELQEASD